MSMGTFDTEAAEIEAVRLPLRGLMRCSSTDVELWLSFLKIRKECAALRPVRLEDCDCVLSWCSMALLCLLYNQPRCWESFLVVDSGNQSKHLKKQRARTAGVTFVVCM